MNMSQIGFRSGAMPDAAARTKVGLAAAHLQKAIIVSGSA
jgi:hypothetical protein